MLAGNSDSSYLNLFQLFISETHPAPIAIHTNLDPAINQSPDLNKQNQKSGENKPEYIKEEVKDKEQFEVRAGNIEQKKQNTSR